MSSIHSFQGKTLTDVVASPKQRKLAMTVFAGLVAGGLGLLPFASVPAFVAPGFLPAYVAVITFAGLLTSVFLFFQFRLSKSRSALILAAMSLFVSMIAIPYVLAAPNWYAIAVTGNRMAAESNPLLWMWVCWHGVGALLIWGYVFALWRERSGKSKPVDRPNAAYSAAAAAVVLVAFGIVYVANRYEDTFLLPDWTDGRNALLATGAGPVIWAIHLSAWLLLVRVTRGKSVLHLWLSAALLASLLDVTLTMFAGTPFTIAWYGAKISSIASMTIILYMFIYELNRLYVHLLDRESELKSVNGKLTVLSFADGLTGIANRRRFDESLKEQFARARRTGTPLSLLMIDIDFFKYYNDCYGHVAGDEVIRTIAAEIQNKLRQSDDLVARYGGEEFAVVLPNTDPISALIVAERLCTAIRKLHMPHVHSPYEIVTVSIGLTTFESADPRMHPRTLVEVADQSLYEAKIFGRNRINGSYRFTGTGETAVQ